MKARHIRKKRAQQVRSVEREPVSARELSDTEVLPDEGSESEDDEVAQITEKLESARLAPPVVIN